MECVTDLDAQSGGMDGFKDLILIFEFESCKAKMANVACLGVLT